MDDFKKFSGNIGVITSVLDGYTKHHNSMTPNIIDERKDNTAVIDVFSRLMMDRIIFLGTPIYPETANIINAQILYLDHVDNTEPIWIYINSPGGSVYDGLGLYDTMQYVKCKIGTINTGMAASMAAVILCGGEPGMRRALKHTRIMIHQPVGGYFGQASDMDIINKEIQKVKKEMYKIMANHTGKTLKDITTDADRDFWMTASESKKYGIIDKVLTKVK